MGTSEYKIKEEKVNLVKLDDFIDEYSLKSIDLLKIDTQGSELKIIKGSTKALSEARIDMIQVEVIHNTIYQGAPTPLDIEKELTHFGYRLVAVSNGGSLLQYYIFQQDLFYVSPNLYKNLSL